MIEVALLLLVFGRVQRLFLGMNGSRVNGVHYRIVRRNGDNGTVEEFPESTLGISSNLAPFQPKTRMVVYSFSLKKQKTTLN